MRSATLTRRHMLALTAGTAGAALFAPARHALASTKASGPRHGMSIFGELKYAIDFPHFDYVNPDAPKGGTLSQVPVNGAYNASLQTFDTLNGYVLKGNSPPRLDFIFDTLMVRAFDEPDAVYGLVALSAEAKAGGNEYIFKLRPEARFHDGSKLTATDVAFSFMLLKDKGYPTIKLNLREMTKAEAVDAQTLRVTFSGDQTRDLPLFIASTLPIFSAAYYATREFDETTLEPPLGSGPYKIGKFKAGDSINYDRFDDYWARDLNVNRGCWNFERLRYEFYRDRTAGFEAFSSGRNLFREEFTSKVWATQYNFPAVKDGRVKLETLPDHTPSGAQGWFINTRREKFSDPRVREALVLAFDFEWTNRNLFYNLYRRTSSFFENSPMRAEGKPSAGEVALLEPYRDELPAAAFGPAVTAPVSDGSGQDRKLLKQAVKLLEDAGWRIKDGIRCNAMGEPLTIEFLNDEPSIQRFEGPYAKNLRLLGIDAKSRLVDSAQYQKRLKTYDFDLTIQRYSLGLTPGIEMRAFWNSEFSKSPGSRNLCGIENPAIDALIEKSIAADTRENQIIVTRALDRVLRAGHYWIPQWNKASYTIAYWDMFERPATPALYDRAVELTWWANEDKAAKLGLKG